MERALTRKWLIELWNQFQVSQEPLTTKEGQIVAEPLIHFRAAEHTYACFGNDLPRKRILQRLEDFNVKVIRAGEQVDFVTTKS